MRIIFLSVFIFCFQFSSFTQSNIDVLHYRYEIKLNDNNDTIYGDAEITMTIPKNSSGCHVDLSGLNSMGRGMKVDSVRIFLRPKTIILPDTNSIKPGPGFIQKDNKIYILFYGGRR